MIYSPMPPLRPDIAPARQQAESNLNGLKRATALMFAVTLLTSSKSWLTTREFPLTPVWDSLPQPPFPLDYALLIAMLVALAFVAILPRPRFSLYTVCAIGCVWALLDLS